MNYTQEQIEAALRYASETNTWDDVRLLGERNQRRMATFNALEILAAAYRELQEAIHSTIAENLHLADGDDCTLKRLKDVIKFELPEEQ